MTRARDARLAGDLSGATDALASAWSHSEALSGDHPLRALVGWRRVKVAFDQGDVDALLLSMEAVTSLAEPFDASAGSALRGAEPISRRLWDTKGYGLPCVERMWAAYTKTWRDAGDPWMAACGETQLAWEWTCAGRLGDVERLIERTARLDPRSFGNGPSRHPLALDAPTSVWFAQMDHARIALQGAVWAHDERLARMAAELYADALAVADREEDDDIWYLEGVGRAECAFGWALDVAPRWLDRAVTAAHPRAAFHRALSEACVVPGLSSLHALVDRFEEADAHGPEWGVDARLVAAHLAEKLASGEPVRWRDEAIARADTFGLGVFGL